jgi:hypothetical protein
MSALELIVEESNHTDKSQEKAIVVESLVVEKV